MNKTIIAFDPGATTGFAVIETNPFTVADMGQISFEELTDWLYNNVTGEYDYVVVEDFRIRGNHARSFIGSRMETIKAIGQIEMWARMNKFPVKLQGADKKSTGAKWSKLHPKGSHANSHYVDAINHAVYFAVSQQHLDVSVLIGKKLKQQN